MNRPGKVLSAGCWVLSPTRPAKSRAGVGGTQHTAHSTQHSIRTQHPTARWTLALLAVLVLAPDAFACAVCYGAPGDPLVKGANNGIMFLLGVVGLVQIGFIAMFWSFWRRARAQRRFRESLRLIEGGPRS